MSAQPAANVSKIDRRKMRASTASVPNSSSKPTAGKVAISPLSAPASSGRWVGPGA
jgi:hypothetical protein